MRECLVVGRRLKTQLGYRSAEQRCQDGNNANSPDRNANRRGVEPGRQKTKGQGAIHPLELGGRCSAMPVKPQRQRPDTHDEQRRGPIEQMESRERRHDYRGNQDSPRRAGHDLGPYRRTGPPANRGSRRRDVDGNRDGRDPDG